MFRSTPPHGGRLQRAYSLINKAEYTHPREPRTSSRSLPAQDDSTFLFYAMFQRSRFRANLPG